MSIPDGARARLEKLQAFREELSGLFQDAAAKHASDLGFAYLRRWRMRVAEYLDAHASKAEAQELMEVKLTHGTSNDPWRNLRDWFKLHEAHLDALIRDLESHQGKVASSDTIAPVINAVPNTRPGAVGSGVFIVHGHDETNLLRLEKLLREKYRLTPIVLRFVAGQGRTLIEKFEQVAETCSFAFVILTPDDVVRTESGRYAQARPNAVFELGWFCGRLGRDRVTMLLKEGTKLHTDLDGISRVEFRESVEEKLLDIERELEAAGLRAST